MTQSTASDDARGWTHPIFRHGRDRSGAQFGLTPRQAALLSFIAEYITANGFSPSYREMADFLGVNSKSNIHRLVVALEERGRITRLPDHQRSIAVVDQR